MNKHKRTYFRKLIKNEKLQKFILLIMTSAVLYMTSIFELANHNNGIINTNLSVFIGIGILIIITEFIGLMYIYNYKNNIYNNNSDLALISLILMIGTILISSSEIISTYLIPVSFISILLAIVYGSFTALAISIPYTAIILCVTNFNTGFSIIYMIGCITGTLLTRKVSLRSSIFVSGILIGLINGLAVFSIELIKSQELIHCFANSGVAIIGGILSSVFAIGFLPIFEQAFDINTPIRMLEISNPNQPLMKKLLFDAPGTYHHSILVGNLSEAAAEAIGANSLLARVGAYYHDIGKIKRPYFFKENQVNNDNPHDKITPKLSAIIITSHVKDGIELAEKFKLPKAIAKIIEEHHGTTLVKYFYNMATVANDIDEEIDDANYRYDGSKPSTKESGIIMMADSIEAAVRSMQNPTVNDIQKMVDKIIKDKIDDGQMNECELTMKELEDIKNAFTKVLGGMFHNRIEYPELSENTSVEEILDGRN